MHRFTLGCPSRKNNFMNYEGGSGPVAGPLLPGPRMEGAFTTQQRGVKQSGKKKRKGDWCALE